MTTGRINQIAHLTLPVRGKRPTREQRGVNLSSVFPSDQTGTRRDSFVLLQRHPRSIRPIPERIGVARVHHTRLSLQVPRPPRTRTPRGSRYHQTLTGSPFPGGSLTSLSSDNERKPTLTDRYSSRAKNRCALDCDQGITKKCLAR